eukprot:TRINITY_DN732_c0_g2_i1.p1 TRINITY_DN732_c0_g2~~TRINITY_DN732_c0_g2_i1.p1  ORF type:complete len:310 (+),score=79.37 TRINITY_DN732_c0_g2_i1:140-1069(+)
MGGGMRGGVGGGVPMGVKSGTPSGAIPNDPRAYGVKLGFFGPLTDDLWIRKLQGVAVAYDRIDPRIRFGSYVYRPKDAHIEGHELVDYKRWENRQLWIQMMMMLGIPTEELTSDPGAKIAEAANPDIRSFMSIRLSSLKDLESLNEDHKRILGLLKQQYKVDIHEGGLKVIEGEEKDMQQSIESAEARVSTLNEKLLEALWKSDTQSSLGVFRGPQKEEMDKHREKVEILEGEWEDLGVKMSEFRSHLEQRDEMHETPTIGVQTEKEVLDIIAKLVRGAKELEEVLEADRRTLEAISAYMNSRYDKGLL